MPDNLRFELTFYDKIAGSYVDKGRFVRLSEALARAAELLPKQQFRGEWSIAWDEPQPGYVEGVGGLTTSHLLEYDADTGKWMYAP